MKKILAILATFGFAITAAFANIELSANLVFAPVYSQTNKITTGGITSEGESKYVCPVGEEVKANFFFYSSKHFDVGLNVGEQVLVYTKDTELDTEYDLGYNASFIIGPAFRLWACEPVKIWSEAEYFHNKPPAMRVCDRGL